MFDFPLTVDSLDAVPEQYRALYQDKDGEITLDGALAAKITKLADTIDKERKRAKDASRDAKAWAELGSDPAEVKTKLEEMEAKHAQEIADLQKLIDEKGDAASKIEKIKAELTKTHQAALSAKDQELSQMEGTLKEHLMEAAAKTAIAEAKGKVKPLLPYVLQNLQFVKQDGKYLVRVVDEDGEVRVSKDGKDMGIRDLVEELKADQDFTALFDGSGVSGSGARPASNGGGGAGVKNPFAKDSLNLTEQMRLKRENPALAERLKSQAG